MNQTFYQFMQSVADPIKQDNYTKFANLVIRDVAFPKQATSYYTIANYIELTDTYYEFVNTFDELWEQYNSRIDNF